MALRPDLAAGTSGGSVAIGDVRYGLLGRIGSARGVQVIAIESQPNHMVEDHITTQFRSLSCLQRTLADGMIRVDRQPWQPVKPLNFFSPGVPVVTRGMEPAPVALCIFGPDFLTAPSRTESGLRLNEIEFLTDLDSKGLIYLGRLMFREAIEPGFASSLFAEAVGMAIAVEIARYDGALPREQACRGGLAPWQLRRLESYVRDHLSDELSLSELAELLGISVRHLSRTVRDAKGISVHRWIAECRISEARRLLIETDTPVCDIARSSGFQSATAFSTAFRAACGFSPGEFRRLSSGRS